jgi:putative sigma-54 modulation protein
MNINFTARHTEITDQTRKYCARRITALEKLLGYPIETDIILSTEKYRQKVEINIKIKGSTINTFEETSDMFSSLVAAFDHIERRIKKERAKLKERKRRKPKTAEMEPGSAEEEREGVARIIPSKDYSLKPMSIEEAAMRLESGRREILVFRNIDTGKWAVLYRRKDGHFGIVKPE